MANASMSSRDDDEISLTSTQSERYDSSQEFDVERILAEKVEGGRKLYLILWEGYRVDESTWEPAKQISPGILVAWRERMLLEQENKLPPFDVAAFEAKLEQLAKDKERRHLLREAKRKSQNTFVSASVIQGDKEDDSDSSIEAAEEDEIEHAPPTKATLKQNPSSPQHQINRKSLKVHVVGRAVDPKPPEVPSGTSAFNQIHKLQPLKTKASTETVPGMRNSPEKLSPSSSKSLSDVPLVKRRKSSKRRSSSSSDELMEFQFSKPNKALEPSSTTVNSQKRGPIMEHKRASEAQSLGYSSSRDNSARGGRGATRGASTIHKNVFAMGHSAASKSTRGNLLFNAADTTKKPRQFANKRLERKVQIQGREMADAAPDISALPGGLFDPSSITSVEPFRPGDLRKPNTNNLHRNEEPIIDPANSHDRMIVDTPIATPPVANYQQSTFVMSTCYFWDRQQRNSNAQPCMRGAACDYLHAYKEGAPIAPAPVERQNFSSSERVSTCYFWNLKQHDKGNPGCSKGDTCTYLHEYQPNIPVAPAPQGFSSQPASFSNSVELPVVHPDSGTINNSAVIDASGVTSKGSAYTALVSTCYYWDKHENDKYEPPCTKGVNCTYLHEYRAGAPIAGHPHLRKDPSQLNFSSSNSEPLPYLSKFDRGRRATISEELAEASPVSTSNRTPMHDESSTIDNTKITSVAPPATAQQGLSSQAEQFAAQAQAQAYSSAEDTALKSDMNNRPAWDPKHPTNAICYYWFYGSCKWTAETCKYYHSNDKRLPVAPSPNGRGIQIHPEGETLFHLENPSQTASREDYRTPPQRNRPAWDSRKPYDSICYFYWTRNGKCVRGSECRYYHTENENLPISPAPGTQIQTCRDWFATGDCRNQHCRFLHDTPVPDLHPAGTSSLPTYKETHLETPTKPRVKSVKFADDDILTDSRSSAHKLEFYSRVLDDVEVDNHSGEYQGEFIQQGSNLKIATRNLQTTKDTSKGSTVISQKEQTILEDSKRNKIKMDDYRRKKTMLQGSRGKEVVFGSNETKSFLLDFTDIDVAKSLEWKKTWEMVSTITFSHICMAQDVRAQQGFFKRRELQELPGNLVPEDPNDAATIKALSAAADELVLRSAGLVSILTNFSVDIGILVFPAKKEEWNFLEGSSEYPTDVRLRYFIFQCDSDVSRVLNSSDSSLSVAQPYRMAMTERLHGLQLATLIPPYRKEKSPYNFFLLFPVTAKQSEDFLTIWIKSVNEKSKIHSSGNDGAWRFFASSTNFDSGAVLVHESAVADLSRLPGLFNLVNTNKRTVFFWCVSDSDTPYPMYPSRYSPGGSEIGRIITTRLFPRGCAFLVTPSFLVSEPQKAYDLFYWFLSSQNPKYSTSLPRSWKLVCCYKLSTYILDLSLAKVAEKEAFEAKNHDKPAKDAMLKERGLSYDHCELRFKLHCILAKLDNQGLLEPSSDHGEAGFESDDSEDTNRPFIYADRSIDPDDEPALIKWFAGWTIRKLDRFKKFVVIGTGTKSASRATRTKEVGIKRSPLQSKVSLSNMSKSAPAQVIESPKIGVSANDKALAVAANLKAASSAESVSQPMSSSDALQTSAAGQQDDDDIVMENSIDQRQDQILSTETVTFIQHTGASIDDANKFLARAENSVPYAIQLYNFDEDVNNLISKEGKMEVDCEPKPEVETKEIRYQGTTEWYEKLIKERGYRWEHIDVADWEKAFLALGVGK